MPPLKFWNISGDFAMFKRMNFSSWELYSSLIQQHQNYITVRKWQNIPSQNFSYTWLACHIFWLSWKLFKAYLWIKEYHLILIERNSMMAVGQNGDISSGSKLKRLINSSKIISFMLISYDSRWIDALALSSLDMNTYGYLGRKEDLQGHVMEVT